MNWNVLRRLLVLLVCWIALAEPVTVAQTGKIEPEGESSHRVAVTSTDTESQRAVQGTSASNVSERPKVEYKTGTYVLLGLSATIGPLVILLLFRKGRTRRSENNPG